VRAELIADADTTGEDFTVGVVLTMEPGWHVYWKNPGDSGLATTVELWLPEGFVAGSLGWPLPESFTQPGNLGAYGYSGVVTLAATVEAPEAWSTDIGVRARVSWLACKDVCLLGDADLELELPLTALRAGAAGDLLEQWRRLLPGDFDEGQPPFTIRLTDGADGRSSTLWLQWPHSVSEVEFFPVPGELLKVEDLVVRRRGNLTRVDLKWRALRGAPLQVTLPAVVVCTTDDEDRRGWEIEIALK